MSDSDRLWWLVCVDLAIDQIGDIDLHERAHQHFVARGGNEDHDGAGKEDYLMAVREAIDAVRWNNRIHAGCRSPLAGALESGSPSPVARDANPHGTDCGGAGPMPEVVCTTHGRQPSPGGLCPKCFPGSVPLGFQATQQ